MINSLFTVAEGPQTVDFYPQDIEKAITFKLFDDKVLEPTEKIELLLFPTDRTTLIKPHDKTTINITLKENGMYFNQEIFKRLKIEV